MKMKTKRRWLCAAIAAAMFITITPVIAAPNETLSAAAAAHAAAGAKSAARAADAEATAYVADAKKTELSDVPDAVNAEQSSCYGEITDESEQANLVAADPVKVETFVTRLYRNFLGREPDPKGLKAWCDVLTVNGGTGASVVKSFVHSKEFQNLGLSDEEYVTCFYRVILGREPDQKGLASWVNILLQGYVRDKVLEGFVNSNEMRLICEDMGVEQGSFKPTRTWNDIVKEFVTRFYRYCLEREPDQPGLEA